MIVVNVPNESDAVLVAVLELDLVDEAVLVVVAVPVVVRVVVAVAVGDALGYE